MDNKMYRYNCHLNNIIYYRCIACRRTGCNLLQMMFTRSIKGTQEKLFLKSFHINFYNTYRYTLTHCLVIRLFDLDCKMFTDKKYFLSHSVGNDWYYLLLNTSPTFHVRYKNSQKLVYSSYMQQRFI